MTASGEAHKKTFASKIQLKKNNSDIFRGNLPLQSISISSLRESDPVELQADMAGMHRSFTIVQDDKKILNGRGVSP